MNGNEYVRTMRSAYNEVVHWRRSVFLLLYGNTGKEFLQELRSLFLVYAQKSAMESVAFEAIMVECILQLRKPRPASKSRDHVAALERRLKAWNDADIDGL